MVDEVVRFYHGNQDATEERIIRYLMSHYNQDRATILTAMQIPQNAQEVEAGIRLTSFANYVGDKIARTQGWRENDLALEDQDRDDSIDY